MKLFKKFLPHLVALFVFSLAALAYFSPVLSGEKLFQSDIQQFIGMAKEINDFRADNQEEPFWTNSSFVGMPTYQLSSYYPFDIIKAIDGFLRFLPRPADYLFLYFLGFFIFLRSLKVEHKLAVLGSLAFGFSTYLIIILGVGHNAKAHAIAYMPMVFGGLIYLKNKSSIKGLIITTLGMALEINASHLQMTYYLLLMVLVFGLVWLVETIKSKEWKSFASSLTTMFIGVGLASGMNATSLLATQEYADFSTRGKSSLSINPDGSAKEQTGGLSYEYITEYSYGILESMDLMYSRFMGGGNSEPLGLDSESYQFLRPKIGVSSARGFVANAPTYWGSQPIVAAPAYVGGSLMFLFLIGALLVRGGTKKWLVASAILSLLLSFGKNLPILTNAFIDYVPLYNKFRAVSSIQVLLEIAVPALAVLGLKDFFSSEVGKEDKLKALKLGFGIMGGLSLLIYLFGSSIFAFSGANDAYFDSMIPGFSSALILDRQSMMRSDALQTLILVLIIASALWLYLQGKLKYLYVILILGVCWTYDLVSVDRRYVNEEDFKSAVQVDKPFNQTAADLEILKDDSYYRVANLSRNMLNDGSTSYFHHSIGGYHAAKPGRFQDLYDFYLSKNHMEVYNLLNTKYFILPQNDTQVVQLNPNANGNAWFIEKLANHVSADELILALGDTNTKEVALYENSDFSDREFTELSFEIDSTASIEMTSYSLNRLEYSSRNENSGFAVFSEAFYQPGWFAYIDDVPVEHYRVDYLLRGMDIPEGNHKIVFVFEPKVVQQGTLIIQVSLGLFIILIATVVYRKFRS